jgi:transcription termination factor NusB
VLKTGYEKHFINVVLRNKNTLQQEIKTTVTKQTWNWLKVEEEIQQEW